MSQLRRVSSHYHYYYSFSLTDKEFSVLCNFKFHTMFYKVEKALQRDELVSLQFKEFLISVYCEHSLMTFTSHSHMNDLNRYT